MTDHDPRDRELAEMANPSRPTRSGEILEPGRAPPGGALVRPTTGLADRIIGAQPIPENLKRNEAVIKTKLTQLAAWAGSDWFYRFPVRKAEGGQDWIEGPSIKLANNVARVFGNNVTEIRELDTGDAWVFYARFTDIETGFSMERAFRQRKGQATLKTKDPQRALDQVYQIGQSKAIRNVIVNALGIYCDYAYKEARNSLVEEIGKDLNGWRQRTLQGFVQMGLAIERVERVIGRASKDWLAQDVSQVVAMARSIKDGMATVDETFPPIEAPAAAATSPTTTQSQTAASGGAQGQTDSPIDATAAQQSSSATTERPAAVDTLSQSEIAYQRGVTAKAEGKRRANIPREYTDGKHDELAAAWLAGFDGRKLSGTIEVPTQAQERKTND